jgi:hypothetical protein
MTFPIRKQALGFTPARGRASGWVGALKKLVFALLLVVFVAFVAHGLTTFQFDETFVNGAIICLACIGVG